MTQKAAAAAPKPAASKPAAPRSAAPKSAEAKSAEAKSAEAKSAAPKSAVAASKPAASKPAPSRRRDSDPMAWLSADDAAFAEHARWLASAKGRATRDRLLRNGLAGEFAARLLSASGEMPRQVESWKLV